MDALEDALVLVGDHLPYAHATPIKRKLLNQATHDRLYPRLSDDGSTEVSGIRNAVYVEADLIVGKDPPELQEGPERPGNGRESLETAKTPIPQGLGSDEAKLAGRSGRRANLDRVLEQLMEPAARPARTRTAAAARAP